MPTTKNRINMTVPDVLYEKIIAYRDEHGIASNASACIQLISQQLRGLENTKKMLEVMSKLTPEQMAQLTEEGYQALRDEGLLPKKD